MRPSAAASALLVLAAALGLGGAGPERPRPDGTPGVPAAAVQRPANAPASGPPAPGAAQPAAISVAPGVSASRQQLIGSAQTVALFALVSLAPVALLMVTAFVRISIVLALLRQALGSPQVPGNQVLTALALLLTALVMQPVADQVYTHAIAPYAAGRASAEQAWTAGSAPIKTFMITQIYRAGHERYLRELYDYAEPPRPERVEPASAEELGLRVVAPAFLLSELTTALVMGFAIYLPFLVIDLVVSTVLMAMGLFMLPPSLVALPLKLIVFVLADGWMLVAGMLLRSFGH